MNIGLRVRTLLNRIFAGIGVGVFRVRGRYSRDGLFTVHSDHFRADPTFRSAYQRGVQASYGVDPNFEWRVHVALWAARRGLSVDGDFVECGVNAGFMSAAIMENLQWNKQKRRFYLVDTFNGPVCAQYSREEIKGRRLFYAEQAMRSGAYVTDVERVRSTFAEWRTAVIVQGTVPEVLETVEFGAVAYLHIDMNCAFPEQKALEFFWDLLSPGGVILMDDYAYFGHECQREAIDDAARVLGADVLSLPTGQGLIIK